MILGKSQPRFLRELKASSKPCENRPAADSRRPISLGANTPKTLRSLFLCLLFVVGFLGSFLVGGENVFADIKIKNPYAIGGGYWYMGNLHSHTDQSDGQQTPLELKTAYDNLGYDFIVSTDHYGDYVNTESQIPYDSEDDGWTADPGGGTINWVVGGEWSGNSDTQAHLGVIGGSRIATSSLTDITSLSETINDFRDSDGDGVIDTPVILNHPMWLGAANSWPDIRTEVDTNGGLDYVAASAIEMANSVGWIHTMNFNDLTGYVSASSPATWKYQYRAAYRYWDSFKELWAVGTDDVHDTDVKYDQGYGAGHGAYGGFSTVIQTPNSSFSADDMRAAVDQGNMYVRENKWTDSGATHTKGTAIDSISVSGDTISVTFAGSVNVTWYKRGLTSANTQSDVTTATYTADGTEGYVICEAIDSNDLHTWTQPFFIMEDTNLAADATVTVSAGVGAINITDEDNDTVWDAGAGPSQWFKIDLGSAQLVNGVEIYWGTSDKFNYQIQFSTDDSNYYTLRHLTYRNDGTTTFNVGDTYARYIKVTASNYSLDNGGNVIVKEAKVYAAPNLSPVERYINTVSGNDNNRGTSDSPWATYGVNTGIYWQMPGDKLTWENDIGTSGGTNISVGTYPGRHPYSRITVSGLYSGSQKTVKYLTIQQNYVNVEDFIVDGANSVPVYVDGTGCTSAGEKCANYVSLKRIMVQDGATASSRLLYANGSSTMSSIVDLRIESCVVYDINDDGTATRGIQTYNAWGTHHSSKQHCLFEQ